MLILTICFASEVHVAGIVMDKTSDVEKVKIFKGLYITTTFECEENSFVFQ